MTDRHEWVRLERSFDAPIDDVWRMWTDPDAFAQWYGPNGASVPLAEMDLRVGGTRKICMEMAMPDRTVTMWFIGTFLDVTAPTRLRYTESMCDADGQILPPERAGMPAGTPTETEVVVQLDRDGDRTHMTFTHIGVPAGSPGEGGWAQAFDKLGQHLAQ